MVLPVVEWLQYLQLPVWLKGIRYSSQDTPKGLWNDQDSNQESPVLTFPLRCISTCWLLHHLLIKILLRLLRRNLDIFPFPPEQVACDRRLTVAFAVSRDHCDWRLLPCYPLGYVDQVTYLLGTSDVTYGWCCWPPHRLQGPYFLTALCHRGGWDVSRVN